jgi:transcriptional regulator with XRE-family HTH domain
MLNGSNNIGRFIRNRRVYLGLTQLELAKPLGYKLPNFISNIETGKVSFPLRRWKDYADALDLDRGRFLFRVLKDFQPEMADYLTLREKPVLD